MDRRTFVRGISAGVATGVSYMPSGAAASEPVDAPAPGAGTLKPWAGFARAHVINGSGDIDNVNAPPPPEAPTHAYQAFSSSVDARAFRDARASGLTALNMTLGHVAGKGDPFEVTVRDILAWNRFISQHPREVIKVDGVADIDTAKKTHRVGIIYTVQNTTALGSDPGRIADFRQLGLRVVQLTYNDRNAVGDGSAVTDDKGLSAFGRNVVEQLQASRLLVDLSHSSQATCLDALSLARRPMVISHGGCRAISDRPRNKTDAELRRLSACGGVIGIYFMQYLRVGGQPHAEDLLAHLEHAINVCGEDHVGIGTDGSVTPYDDLEAFRRSIQADIDQRRALGIQAPGETSDVLNILPDLTGVDQFSRLAALLSARGHGDARIGKILGGNFQRAMRDAWS